MPSPLISSATLSVESLSGDVYSLIVSLRPHWSPAKFHFQQLTGGISNATFRLSNDGDPSDTLVIKIFGSKTEEFLDRNAEFAHLAILSSYGLAQPVLLHFNNGYIYNFLPGCVCDESVVREKHIAPLIARHLARFHSVPLHNEQQKPCLIPLLRKFLSLIGDIRRLPAEFASLPADVDWIENVVLPRMIPDLVLCHNDLVSTNILYHPATPSVSFIDFEYCAVNYALFDVANHFVEYAGVEQIHFDRYPDRAEKDRWLKTYFAARNLPIIDLEKISEQIDQFAALSHLCFGLWAFVQVGFAKIDVDYASYGHRRLHRYKQLKAAFLDVQTPVQN